MGQIKYWTYEDQFLTQNVQKLIFKSPTLNIDPFGANLAHFGADLTPLGQICVTSASSHLATPRIGARMGGKEAKFSENGTNIRHHTMSC